MLQQNSHILDYEKGGKKIKISRSWKTNIFFYDDCNKSMLCSNLKFRWYIFWKPHDSLRKIPLIFEV